MDIGFAIDAARRRTAFDPEGLKALRLATGLTQADLAGRLTIGGIRVSASTVCLWEAGLHRPRPRALRALRGAMLEMAADVVNGTRPSRGLDQAIDTAELALSEMANSILAVGCD